MSVWHRDPRLMPAARWPTCNKGNVHKLQPEKLGFEIIDKPALKEMTDDVKSAMINGRDESFAILDMGTIVDRYKLWTRCFPKIRPFFAVKCNDDPAILNLLAHLGAGFDCASKLEVENALDAGAVPDDIVFANIVKFPSHLRYIAEKGVQLMTFDSEDELIKMRNDHPNARLLLRLECDEVEGGVQIKMSNTGKFGCPFTNIRQVLQMAKQLRINVIGVSFHCGSGITDAMIYIKSIEFAKKVFDLAEEEGIHMNVLDIGGGLYGDSRAETSIYEMCGPINTALERLFPKENGIKVISEPGRFFAESAMNVATCVIGKKVTHNDSACLESSLVDLETQELTRRFHYYLSESIYGYLWFLLRNGSSPAYKVIQKNPTEKMKYQSTLWGPTCDPADIIQGHTLMPEMDIGSWLIVQNMGAYSAVMGGTFNALPKCPIRRVMEKAKWEQLTRSSLI